MGKKHDHIMLELARLGMRVESLERLVDAMRPTDSLPTAVSNASYGGYDWDHPCRFMPPGFRVQRRKPDGWRLRYDDDDAPAPLINFCPYCGVKLCEPEIP